MANKRSRKLFGVIFSIMLLTGSPLQSFQNYNQMSFLDRCAYNWQDFLTKPDTHITIAMVCFAAYCLSKANQPSYTPITTNVSFNQVIGAQKAKEALLSLKDALKNPQKYHRVGARLPKGVLLEGAPGNGKTLLAKALAGEAGVPFFYITSAEFSAKYIGVGPDRVRTLFAEARKAAPCIIFIDEFDGIGVRSSDTCAAAQEDNKIIAELLTQIDGMQTDPNKPIIIMGATNHKERIDEAFLRSGRFDMAIEVPLPTQNDRQAIIRLYAQKITAGSDVDYAALAAATEGFVGADLENLVNQAAINAVRRNGVSVKQQDFLYALQGINASKEKNKAKVASCTPKAVLSPEVATVIDHVWDRFVQEQAGKAGAA